MARHLELLLAIDTYTRENDSDYVSRPIDIYTIARDAGLAAWGDKTPATWTGELVEAGYLTHAPPSPGDPLPLPSGAMWVDHDL